MEEDGVRLGGEPGVPRRPRPPVRALQQQIGGTQRAAGKERAVGGNVAQDDAFAGGGKDDVMFAHDVAGTGSYRNRNTPIQFRSVRIFNPISAFDSKICTYLLTSMLEKVLLDLEHRYLLGDLFRRFVGGTRF